MCTLAILIGGLHSVLHVQLYFKKKKSLSVVGGVLWDKKELIDKGDGGVF